MESKNIICIAPHPWSEMWKRRHHIMSRLAKMNRVLFVEPQRSVLTPLLHRRTRGWDLDFRFGLRRESDNLYVYAPLNPLPMARVRLVGSVNDAFVHSRIGLAVRHLKMHDPILWLYYTPKTAGIATALVRLVRPQLVCYDCYDYNAGFDDIRPSDRQHILEEERELVEMADIVFAASAPLYHEKKRVNPNAFLVPNGVDIALYERQTPVPDDIAVVRHPIVGLAGKISGNTIDMGLIRDLLESRPQWSVVLVGPVYPDVQRVVATWPQYENLHLLGRKAKEELPAYLNDFDVCIAPYLTNDHTGHVDAPLKVYEYLAAGKPIVATGFSPARFLRGCVRIATSRQEFINLIELSLGPHDDVLESRRIDTARQNSWDDRVREMSGLIEQRLRQATKTSCGASW